MIKSCPLCGRSVFVARRFDLFRCECCDVVVNAALWRPEANEHLNDATFGDDYEPVSSFWVRGFEVLSNRRRMRILEGFAVPQAGELLEVGVGSGSFLMHAAARGFSVLGCDLSPAICRRVERKSGRVLHCGPVASLPPGTLFDVVVMNHVLEHVSDPVALLRDARARLKPGGTLQLAVPNVGAWEARLRGWNSYEPYHLLYFTPETLRLTAERAGFRVMQVKTHESFSGWALAISRTLLGWLHHERGRGRVATAATKRSTLVEHAYRVVLVAWGVITIPLRCVQEWLGHGDEVILVAKNVSA